MCSSQYYTQLLVQVWLVCETLQGVGLEIYEMEQCWRCVMHLYIPTLLYHLYFLLLATVINWNRPSWCQIWPGLQDIDTTVYVRASWLQPILIHRFVKRSHARLQMRETPFGVVRQAFPDERLARWCLWPCDVLFYIASVCSALWIVSCSILFEVCIIKMLQTYGGLEDC